MQAIQHVRLGAAGQLIADEGVEAAEKVARGGWRNVMSNPLMAELGVPVMHTWNYSVPIWNLHHHYQACPCRSQLEVLQASPAGVLAAAARPLKADELVKHALDMLSTSAAVAIRCGQRVAPQNALSWHRTMQYKPAA